MNSPSQTSSAIVTCRLSAAAGIRANAATLASWRRNPGNYQGKPLPPTFLKNAEHLSVAIIGALLQAIDRAGWQDRSFADWGAVAGPALFGRGATAQCMQRFQAEGAWGVSPHMIPHHSLHAPSGTVSLLLKAHGPNYTVSGGPQAPAEAFLAAAGMSREVPGLWLVLAGFSPELIPDSDDPMAIQPLLECRAAALALEPMEAQGGQVLRIGMGNSLDKDARSFDLGDFVMALENKTSSMWRLPGSGWIEVSTTPLAA